MAKANDIKYLTAIKTEKPRKKFCRFKKYGIRYIDYKDGVFLLKFINNRSFNALLIGFFQQEFVLQKNKIVSGC